MSELDDDLAPLVTDFHGVVSVSTDGDVEFERAYGLANRQHGIANTIGTQFATASGTKTFTALAVAALIEDGVLDLATTARSVLGADLPLIADDVTVEHLLTHRSGIGDYCDEDLDELPPPTVPYYDLQTTASYLPALDGFPTKFAAGTRFSYCNGGFVVLALIAERRSGVAFAQLLADRVWQPAGMVDTAFLRSDDLPARAATGYLDNGRTNLFSVPLVGSGDGGAYTTVADLRAFWWALLAGRIVSTESVRRMTTPTSDETGEIFGYGEGVWLAPELSLAVMIGGDNGVSLSSAVHPTSRRVVTVLSNTGEGAYPIARHLRELLFA